MGVEQLHAATRTWKYLQDKDYTIPYSFLERVFNDQALKEGVISDKECIKIKWCDTNDQSRSVNLSVEIFKLQEN